MSLQEVEAMAVGLTIKSAEGDIITADRDKVAKRPGRIHIRDQGTGNFLTFLNLPLRENFKQKNVLYHFSAA